MTKIKITVIHSVLFSILLLAQLYVPSFRVNILLQLFALGFIFYSNHAKISVKFLNTIAPLCFLFVLPLVVGLFYFNNLENYIKDVFYFLKPVIGVSLGYLFFKKINNLESFLKVIIFTGFISTLIHFIVLLFFTNFLSGNVAQIREYGKDNFLELFALFLFVYRNRFVEKEIFSKKHQKLIFFFLLVSCIMYLSRTMLIVAFIMYATMAGYTKITKKTISVLGIFAITILLFYTYLYSTNIKRGADGIEGFLYKLKIAPAELFKTKVDRNDHSKLWDYWRAYEALRAIELMNETPTSYIHGTGFGSLVNLKFNAPLVDSAKGIRFISETHNGYVFAIYKSGIIGLFLMMFFLFSLYRLIYLDKNTLNIFISGIALTFIFTTLTITGIFNKRDIIIFILGGLIYFQQRRVISNER